MNAAMEGCLDAIRTVYSRLRRCRTIQRPRKPVPPKTVMRRVVMVSPAISLVRSCAAITAWPRLSSAGSSNAHRRGAARSNACRFQASQVRSIPCDFCASYWFRNVIGPPASWPESASSHSLLYRSRERPRLGGSARPLRRRGRASAPPDEHRGPWPALGPWRWY
jgi:hypothetical protein